MKVLFTIYLLFLYNILFAQGSINGVVKDNKGNILAFSSILIKGTEKGTTANKLGKFAIELNNGTYVLLCQHIGYLSVEKKVTVKNNKLSVDFILEEQRYDLHAVTVQSGGEDLAYAIIRKAIAKKAEYANELKNFQVQVYIKGQLQLRDFPKKFLGQKIDFEDGDTSKKKMIYLSESVSNYAVNGNKKKVEVISTKVSGQSNEFGFAQPALLSFYNNAIEIGEQLNPRGFISPIADNAVQHYKYQLKGTFFENGMMVNHIKVIPKRNYEPLFNGYINIIEDTWRIQSIQLTLFKKNQMQLLDTLHIEQLYIPLQNIWVLKQQVIYPAGKFFGFDFFGSFLQLFSNYHINPSFKKNYFTSTILKYSDSSNKKSLKYWDSIRPVPLLENEVIDYKKKDSLEQLRNVPRYIDSIERKENKPSFVSLFLTGYSYSKSIHKTSLSFDPLISVIGIYYNPVEGMVSNYGVAFNRQLKNGNTFSISPKFRYGYHNRHFNTYLNAQYIFGKKHSNQIILSGGKKVFQLNNENPISEIGNTLSTYFWQQNYMKIYEAYFSKFYYNKKLGNGLNIYAIAEFQNRIPLENTIYSLKGNVFSPNYPTDLLQSNFTQHKALVATTGFKWQPGARYIELPNQRINISQSGYPVMWFSVTQGIDKLLGSEVNYTKWNFRINQLLNLKLAGHFQYNIETGGFLNANKAFVQDFQHYLGDQSILSTDYMRGFQLLPYYQFSNTENHYATVHAEYHLDGIFTNKIPLFKKLNWFVVVGANALFINHQIPYYEALLSAENIFKVFRVDLIQNFSNNIGNKYGIKAYIPLFSNNGNRNN